ncbi:hypothetical protein [Mycobacterium tuberculosis]|uniref:hypothetical protein n=1 Tax=Mycobacterium tuberculosis TaxID=1773 RepID=UPI00272C8CBC|nr:hypothetical protein [Mycobacterium tuberculosis]
MIEAKIYEEFTTLLKVRLAKLRMGNPLDSERTAVGHACSIAHRPDLPLVIGTLDQAYEHPRPSPPPSSAYLAIESGPPSATPAALLIDRTYLW